MALGHLSAKFSKKLSHLRKIPQQNDIKTQTAPIGNGVSYVQNCREAPRCVHRNKLYINTKSSQNTLLLLAVTNTAPMVLWFYGLNQLCIVNCEL